MLVNFLNFTCLILSDACGGLRQRTHQQLSDRPWRGFAHRILLLPETATQSGDKVLQLGDRKGASAVSPKGGLCQARKLPPGEGTRSVWATPEGDRIHQQLAMPAVFASQRIFWKSSDRKISVLSNILWMKS